jgi:hypothetical protein
MLDLTERPPSTEARPAVVEPLTGPPITIPKETIPPRAPWGFETTLGGEAAVGLLPGLPLGGRFAIALEPPRLWRIEIAGTLWQKREIEPDPGGVRLTMWTADLAICPLTIDAPSLKAWGCIAQRAGMVLAQGLGFDRNASRDDTLLAAEARFGATWTFAAPFALHAALGLGAPLVRLSFVYRTDQGGVSALYRMPPVAGFLALGIGARF